MARSNAAEIAALKAQLAALQAEEETGVYEDSATGRWYVRFKVLGSWTTRRTAPDGSALLNRDQALIARGLWAAQAERSELAIGRYRFEDYWPKYLTAAKAEMTHGSWVDLRSHGAKRLLPFFSGRQLGSIDVMAVRDWRAVMFESVEAGDIAAKTVNNARIALSGCFRMAVSDRLMTFNPVNDVKPLTVEIGERPYLTLAQINDYVDACSAHYRPLAQTLIGSGARVSEAIAMQVLDVDAHAETVNVFRQLARDTVKDVTTRQTKGKKKRVVNVGPGLIRVLEDMLAVRREHATEDNGWLFLLPAVKRGRYAGRSGRPPHRHTVHDWHEQALKDAGLPDMPLHSLRHTAANAWLSTGRSLEFVKAQLGHSSVKVTSDYYGHLEEGFRALGAADTERRIAEARQVEVVL